VGTDTRDPLTLAAVLLLMVGFYYYYVVGVHYADRALSRASALASLVCGVVAVVILVRVVL
jgi:hypothetical protein